METGRSVSVGEPYFLQWRRGELVPRETRIGDPHKHVKAATYPPRLCPATKIFRFCTGAEPVASFLTTSLSTANTASASRSRSGRWTWIPVERPWLGRSGTMTRYCRKEDQLLLQLVARPSTHALVEEMASVLAELSSKVLQYVEPRKP